jgi:hypothetical protein
MTRNSVPRISELIGCRVTATDGRQMGIVKDVRLAPTGVDNGLRSELMVAGIVIGQRHTGSLLGYDRQPKQGPWLVRTVVRWLHRNSGYLPWSAVADVDWTTRVVRSRTDRLDELTHPSDQ